MQSGYNEQITVDNKNGLIIAVTVTQDANDQKQLIPMIEKTQETLQNALNISQEESEQIIQNTDILADNGYYTNQTIHDLYDEGKYSILIPQQTTSNSTKRLPKKKKPKKTKQQYSVLEN